MHFGFAGVFGVALLDASPLPVPIPGSADLLTLILAANRANPIWLAAVGVAGSAIGAYLTWAMGAKGGEELLDRQIPKRARSRVERWSKKYGAFSVFLAGLAPPPLPTLPFLLAAGAGGSRARRVIPAFAASRVIGFGLEAYLGYRYGHEILRLWGKYESSESVQVVLWVLVGLIVGGLGFGGWRLLRKRGAKGSHRKK